VSGKKYVYDVRPREPARARAYRGPGNFIWAKMDEHRRWVPVYIGAGDLTQCAAEEPQAAKYVDAEGATHVHIHANFDRESRLAEARDLLENFPEAGGTGREARSD
jgi:hypothetical protein